VANTRRRLSARYRISAWWFTAVQTVTGRATGFRRQGVADRGRLRGTAFGPVRRRRGARGRQRGRRDPLRRHDQPQRAAETHVFHQRQVHQGPAVDRPTYA